MKGAPQVVLKRAHDFTEIHQQVEHKITEFANRWEGAVIGVALQMLLSSSQLDLPRSAAGIV